MRLILGLFSLAAFAVGIFWSIVALSRPTLPDILILLICFGLAVVFRAWRARLD